MAYTYGLDKIPDQQYLSVYYIDEEGDLGQYSVAADLPLTPDSVEEARNAVESDICYTGFSPLGVFAVVKGGKA